MSAPVDELSETRRELKAILAELGDAIPADWWKAQNADRAWIESQQQQMAGEDEEDDRAPEEFK